MNARKGFTILELVIVLAIGAVFATIVVARFGGVMDRVATRSAQTDFLSMRAHTRALALERGVSVRLTANPASGIVTIQEQCAGGGTVVQTSDFGARHGVIVETGGIPLLLCMTPRGYADPNQNSFVQEAQIAFRRGDQVQEVVLLPLGQALRP